MTKKWEIGSKNTSICFVSIVFSHTEFDKKRKKKRKFDIKLSLKKKIFWLTSFERKRRPKLAES